jgi:dephospho-CoA kinase
MIAYLFSIFASIVPSSSFYTFMPDASTFPCEEFHRLKREGQMLIGLTGGIGSGKTTVATMLAERGCVVMSSDDIGRELTATNAEIQRRIIVAFPRALAANGSLNRAALAREVFGAGDDTAAALATLNAIIHPAVFAEIARRAGECFARGERFVFNETALLFETGIVRCYDLAVVVDAPEEVRVKRLVEHRGLDAEDARRRIRSQLPTEQKRAAAHYVIENAGDLESTRHTVELFLDELRAGRLPSVLQR